MYIYICCQKQPYNVIIGSQNSPKQKQTLNDYETLYHTTRPTAYDHCGSGSNPNPPT